MNPASSNKEFLSEVREQTMTQEEIGQLFKEMISCEKNEKKEGKTI